MSLIEKWKNDDSVTRFSIENNSYGIRIIGRGDNLFFQENGNALICEIDAVNAVIFAASIKNWSGLKRMSAEEKERVLTLIEASYKTHINNDVTVLR